jgi:hypothetical protein
LRADKETSSSKALEKAKGGELASGAKIPELQEGGSGRSDPAEGEQKFDEFQPVHEGIEPQPPEHRGPPAAGLPLGEAAVAQKQELPAHPNPSVGEFPQHPAAQGAANTPPGRPGSTLSAKTTQPSLPETSKHASGDDALPVSERASMAELERPRDSQVPLTTGDHPVTTAAGSVLNTSSGNDPGTLEATKEHPSMPLPGAVPVAPQGAAVSLPAGSDSVSRSQKLETGSVEGELSGAAKIGTDRVGMDLPGPNQTGPSGVDSNASAVGSEPRSSLASTAETVPVHPAAGDIKTGTVSGTLAAAGLENPRDSAVLENPQNSSVLESPRNPAVLEDPRTSAVLESPDDSERLRKQWDAAVSENPQNSSVLESPPNPAVLEDPRTSGVQENIDDSETLEKSSESGQLGVSREGESPTLEAQKWGSGVGDAAEAATGGASQVPEFAKSDKAAEPDQAQTAVGAGGPSSADVGPEVGTPGAGAVVEKEQRQPAGEAVETVGTEGGGGSGTERASDPKTEVQDAGLGPPAAAGPPDAEGTPGGPAPSPAELEPGLMRLKPPEKPKEAKKKEVDEEADDPNWVDPAMEVGSSYGSYII